jgi:glutamate N-acetyltransferase / amino-acid N-acetyltransferase
VSAEGGARGALRDARQGPAALAPFFSSRWVKAPSFVRDLGLQAGLPAGFRAAGVASGIKASGRPDVGLLVCDASSCTSAARFTASSAAAAPVRVCKDRCDLAGLRALLVNSGCANAATGERGIDDAQATQRAAAVALGVEPSQVAVASTGGIRQFLPRELMLRGIERASGELRPDGDADFQRAIETTDTSEKRACLELELAAGMVRIAAQCKGAGMISPRFATMLCFIETDAALEASCAEPLLRDSVGRSFARTSVDGQLSTNDTVIMIASGASGVRVPRGREDEVRFGEALDALLRQLAILLVADGEGARRIARVRARGGDGDRLELAARAVANSPLVKAALYGGDPNWGRILVAVGGALPALEPLAMDISIEGIQVCRAGGVTAYDEAALARAVEAAEVEYELRLPGDGAQAEVFFSDLSHDYVTLNAEYTT